MANSHHLVRARKGREAWNAWRRENPKKPADFSGVNFMDPENENICSAGFEFGENADFSDTIFGDAPETFRFCYEHEILEALDSGECPKGAAFFLNSTFGHNASFIGASFGENARFDQVVFGRSVKFQCALFGYQACFEGVYFESSPRFDGATFGDEASFAGAVFGGLASFSGAAFGYMAIFSNTVFAPFAEFSGAAFRDFADFSGASFEGSADFKVMPEEVLQELFREVLWDSLSNIARGRVNANWEKMKRGGHSIPMISFRNVRFKDDVSFENRVFEGEVDLAHAHFMQVPNFSSVQGIDHLSIANARFGFRGRLKPLSWISGWRWCQEFTIPTPGWTTNPDIPSRLRRLRQIANELHATDAERDLFILERMAERGVSWRNEWRRPWRPLVPTLLMGLYRLFSDCGRSVILPLLWLVGSNGGFYFWYGSLVAPGPRTERVAEALFTFTLANAVPFVGATRQSLGTAIETLFSNGVPPLIQALSMAQGILSGVFVFLAALALRNYFKVK